MQIATNAVAGFHAAAGVARLQSDLGVCANPTWYVGTSRAGHSDNRTVMITESKFHDVDLRQPLEPSP